MMEIGKDIEILKDGQVIATVGFADDAVYHRELMGEHYVLLVFHMNDPYIFDRGHYVVYKGQVFMIRQENPPEEISLYDYKYSLRFEAIEMQLQDVLMFYTLQGAGESQWSMTSTAEGFLRVALENIRRYFGDDAWQIQVAGTADEAKTLEFDGDTIFDALTAIAEAFECEWYVQDKTLHFVQRLESGEYIELGREKELAEITRSNENNEEYCTRLYAFGSSRNIPAGYRRQEGEQVVDALVSRRLKLPLSTPGYIDAFPFMQGHEVVERVKYFEDIYPQRTGQITGIRTEEKKDEDGVPYLIYFFKDQSLDFSEEYILAGETLMVAFAENSRLNGRDFELAYHEKTREFEIIINTDNPGMMVPNELLCPRIGDKYVLYNFDISMVGEMYVPQAEEELLEKATEWLQEIVENNSTYTCRAAVRHCYYKDINLPLGQRVRLKSLLFKDGFKQSRVYGFTKKLYCEHDATYLVGDTSSYSRLASIDKAIESNKKLADIDILAAMAEAKKAGKGVKALSYLKTALENETSIEGGLILTTLIKLGMMVGDEWLNTAGVNGVYENEQSPAFWAGGTLDEAIENLAAVILRMDGSGHLAKGNISWDALGNTIFNGVVTSTDENGNRIIVNAASRSITIQDKDGDVMGVWSYEASDSGLYDSIITLNFYDKTTGKASLLERTVLRAGSLSVRRYTSETDYNEAYIGVNGTKVLNSLVLEDIPTSPIGFPIGSLWRDGNTIKIVTE